MTELTGSLSLAVLCSIVITAGLVLVGQVFDASGRFLTDRTELALFALTTLVASWAILIPTKLWEGRRTSVGFRRLVLAGMGTVVGTVACWFDRVLLIDLPRPDGLFDAVGRHGLVDAIGQPTLMAWVTFFTLLFGLRRWWMLADSWRTKRFRVGSAMLTLLLGYVASIVFAFPSSWGLMVALSIASVVQLSATWVPHEDRIRG